MMLAKKSDPEKSTILAMLLDATQKIAKSDGNRETSPHDLLVAAKKELKMAQQSIDAGIDVGKTVAVLQAFIPDTKGQAETKAIVDSLIAELPEKRPQLMGKVMGSLKKEYGDDIDMGLASQLVKEGLLST